MIVTLNRPTLNWGTYRPGYYFGLRARHPRSPLFGFMWYDAGKYEGLSQSRHACQDSDRMSTYGWHRHNSKDFGQQVCLYRVVSPDQHEYSYNFLISNIHNALHSISMIQ